MKPLHYTGDWTGAANLIARILVVLGLGLALLGFGRLLQITLEIKFAPEVIATIEKSSSKIGGGGLVQLAWRDSAGLTRSAQNVSVSRALGRKMKIGNALSREYLRIRYQPDHLGGRFLRSVVVVEDQPEDVKSIAALAIAGCLAITSGSLIILALMLHSRFKKSAGAPEQPT